MTDNFEKKVAVDGPVVNEGELGLSMYSPLSEFKAIFDVCSVMSPPMGSYVRVTLPITGSVGVIAGNPD